MAQATDMTSNAIVASAPRPGEPEPLILGRHDFGSVTDAVARVAEARLRMAWIVAFAVALSLLALLVFSIAILLWEGIGIWGVNIPVGWGFAIVNFVWWIGIGHAGTLISAILHLFRQQWRTSINRFAEAMTIFAVACAGIFPGIHVGRAWVAYWLFPVPNQMSAWPQFRSPLLWDVFAVSTYATVSVIFWYMGMIPDFATFRDRSRGVIRKLAYGVLAMGWRGSARHWNHYESAYMLLAALAAPLVLSVHTIVSYDFAVAQLPGWHATIFPPYFVAGAVYSGFAMVETLIIPCRRWFKLADFITLRHLENMNKIMLVTGMMVGYSYMVEFFTAWYSGSAIERFTFVNRAFGPYAWAYWTMISCNVLAPQFYWFRWFRRCVPFMFVVSLVVNVGMWLERFVIVVSSLSRDFLPSSWSYYRPTFFDVSTFLGSFGLFFTLFLLFIRFGPVLNMFEIKGIMPKANPHGAGLVHGATSNRPKAGEGGRA
jgi:molybdopterin-containing oxidoreductase family membrane subunit